MYCLTLRSDTSTDSVVFALQLIFGVVNVVATCSRQLFAFARDNGVPGSAFLSHVRPGQDIPVNSVLVSFISSIALAMINIGSPVAFNSIASLGVCSLLSSYVISIGCMFLKRCRKEPLLPSHFSLGRFGIWINGIAIMYLCIAILFAFFPVAPNPPPALMNWNILIFGIGIIFGLVYFYGWARKVYVGPVEYIQMNC
jgi:choline transport protein